MNDCDEIISLWRKACAVERERKRIERLRRQPQAPPLRSPVRKPTPKPAMLMEQIPQMRQVLICSVCNQEITREKRDQTAKEVLLFGAAAFGVCCCCLQAIPRWLFGDEDYHGRWIDYRHRILTEQSS
jgi:hypothetical protein